MFMNQLGEGWYFRSSVALPARKQHATAACNLPRFYDYPFANGTDSEPDKTREAPAGNICEDQNQL